MEKLMVKSLYDLSHTAASPLLSAVCYPWEALPLIKDFILSLIEKLDREEYIEFGDNVFIHKSATVAKTASISGPAIIGAETEVRHCAFIRGSALIGKNCVVGNSTELKNVILFDNVQVPHYNYVGDSILGYRSHMGAGAITSNVKSDKTLVTVSADEKIETGLKKFGAMLGDYVEVGCGSVLNPGTVIGKNTNIYPLSSVRGFVPEGSIYKRYGEVAQKH
ncbi:MAG: UDP-N-acetylglucosamine pyrophosphorylase [Clostridia bacterium]|nr:UDP-N-acetylglucosamine pyrophosphorylase [Clostridia bacterium]